MSWMGTMKKSKSRIHHGWTRMDTDENKDGIGGWLQKMRLNRDEGDEEDKKKMQDDCGNHGRRFYGLALEEASRADATRDAGRACAGIAQAPVPRRPSRHPAQRTDSHRVPPISSPLSLLTIFSPASPQAGKPDHRTFPFRPCSSVSIRGGHFLFKALNSSHQGVSHER